MNKASVIHESKSRYSYMYDETTIHVRVKTQIKDVKSIEVLSVDPFNWSKHSDGVYRFDVDTIIKSQMKLEGETMYHDIWFAEIKNIDTLRVRYGFIITDNEDEKYFFGVSGIWDLTEENIHNVYDYFNFPYLNKEDMYKAPSWAKDAIWYQITPTAYSDNGETPKDNTKGNFKGLIKKLDYIEDMGFTAIYFTPIFDGRSWHLYDTTDYFNVDEKLGGNKDFKHFIDEAHKRRIKVMLDGVFNHCGQLHPYWQDVIKNGKHSKYYDCFFILDESKPIIDTIYNEDGSYVDNGSYKNNIRTFAYSLNMPKLNTDNPIMAQHILDVGTFWVKEFGIDGWRLDVSNEVSHDFWKKFRKAVKDINPDVYIMGENWDDSYSWLSGDQFDSVMNYGLMNCVCGFLVPGKGKFAPLNASEYKRATTQTLTRYPKNVTEHMFNLIDSHDTDRISNICGGNLDLIKLAYVLQMTYGGSPCVYYGDEVGLKGEELGNRVPMIWDESKQNLELKNHIKTLIALRKKYKSFSENEIEWILTDDNSNTIIFKKSVGIEKTYIIVHNNNDINVIDTPEELMGQTFTNLYTGKEIKFAKEITLSPYEFIIIN